MAEVRDETGLGIVPKKDWPNAPRGDKSPIARLVPGTTTHSRVRDYLMKRLDESERRMTQFYPRWQYNESRFQAYIDLPDWEQQLKTLNNAGEPPKAVSIVIPYSYATVATIVTYLIHTFCGRKPIFQISTNKDEYVTAAMNMEHVIQYQADATRLIKHMFQTLQDGEIYGCSIQHTSWNVNKAMRTSWTDGSSGFLGLGGRKKVKTRSLRTVYEGNKVEAIDPFMFFPDPRVPMCEVNKRGEYVFWRSFVGKHTLKQQEASGELAWVDYIGNMPRATDTTSGNSSRGLLSGGESSAGVRASELSTNYSQIDQGTVWVIPRELGLGEESFPQLWQFTIANKRQIVQAERYDADHGMHPVAVSEPYTMGYGFGQPGVTDYLGPLQDTISWFVNSHIANVRTALNNMFVVDPSMIEMQDLKNPDAGKLIRLKQAAYGQDVRTALTQLPVQDVTSGHVRDLELMMRMGDSLSSVVDNVRGLQDSGGRKTATEVRTAGEAAASRLAAHTRLISAQQIVDLAEQMCLNTQQYLSEEFYLSIMGQKGIAEPIRVSPEMLVGDFQYPINDGTLPLDRVALLDVWRQIFVAVAQDPELRQEFSVGGIFEYTAELGGAQNLERFKAQPAAGPPNVSVQPNEAVDKAVQAGNAVPIRPSGNVNAAPGAPGRRAIGG